MMRILLVDDHPIFRSGFRHLVLQAVPDAQFVGVDNVEQALVQIETRDWDLIAFDLGVPGGQGLDSLETLRLRRPETPVLALGMPSDGPLAAWALRCGASGYISKKAPAEEVVAAVQRVLVGGKYVEARLAERLAGKLAEPEALHEKLTKREFQVLLHLASGMPLTQIASQLGVTAKTVGSHRSRIRDKLQVETDAQIVRYAVAHRLLS